MARGKKDTTRRGSPEAIAKRRSARALNTLFARGASSNGMDGRTLKRKNRLLEELKNGKGGATIKAHEVLSHVTELLGMGESLTTIRALKPRLPPPLAVTDESIGIIKETQASYNFDPRAWKFLGVDLDAVMSDNPAKATTRKAGRKKKS